MSHQLTEAALAECAASVGRWPPEDEEASVVVLAFATALPPQWLLGSSAALHGVPLALLGLGQPFGGMGKAVVQKLHAVGRAARLLRKIAPHAAIIVADAWDTLVVNPPSASAPLLLRELGSSFGRALLSSECNSWPRCYASEVRADADGSRCMRTPGATCFVNSGLFAASARTLEEALLPAALAEMSGRGPAPMHRVEVGHDQAAMTRAWLNRAAHGARLGFDPSSLRVDTASELFVSLYQCAWHAHSWVTARERAFTRCAMVAPGPTSPPLLGMRVHG